MALVDQYGRPIKPAELLKDKSGPTLAGVRTIWDSSVASGLTPQGLAGLLQQAAQGDHDAYLTLAEEIEERDLHYAAELGKRKLAVTRLPISVEAATDDERDQMLADEVSKLVRKPGFRALLKNLLDGIGKGFSVAEIDWDRSGSTWTTKGYKWRDPHFFQFERIARREIRLRDEADLMDGLPLEPYGYITHVPLLKSGIPIRGGLARLAAWAYMCKGYTVKDWLAFAEVFGMPLRMGKYGANASEDDKSVLRMAVANLGSDAAAIFPESMQIELVEAGNKGGSADFFERLANYLDDQVSKGVLGQTASSSGTPGKLGDEKLQSEVRDDIRDDDAEQLAETINRDLVKPFIDLNWGPQEEYPAVKIAEPDKDNVELMLTACEKLVPFGFRVEQSVIRDKVGLPDPDPNVKPEDLLQPSQPILPPQPPVETENNQQRALNSQQQKPDTADIVAAKLAEVAQPKVNDLLHQVRQILAESESFTEFLGKIDALDLNLDDIGEVFAQAMSLADLSGRNEVNDEAGL